MWRSAVAVATVIVLSLAPAFQPELTAQKPADDFSKLTDEFVYGSLALDPVLATESGYHVHDGVQLDEQLDDYSPAGVEKIRKFYEGFRSRLVTIDQRTLLPEERADYRLIYDQIGLSLVELETIEVYRHNPTFYVEMVGNALFNPLVLDYAPLDTRFRQIIARLSRVPTLMNQAKANLADSPEIWSRVAQEENDGNIDLIENTLRPKTPANLKANFERAAGPALDSLRAFNAYLKNDLSKKTSDWRLGKEHYAQKFAYMLDVGKPPEQVLAEAETALKETRVRMDELAAPKTVREALDEIAQQHTTPEHFMDEAREDLVTATTFVRQKRLVSFPQNDNLQVIPTPEFMRGIYGVAGFDAAPPLEPQLGAFYWVTPIPADWPKEQIDSKLREYNRFGFMEITIHEAMPGHYVQFEVANNLQPKSRRALRAIYGNTPYIEGWAFYTQQMMSEQGFMNNSKALWLSYYKQLLRSIANAILDIRLQTMGMTDQQALDLMINDTFQEKEEAVAKLQRAQLSSAQLPTYFVGLRGWLDAREEYQRSRGSAFSLSEFHNAALKESAVPLPVLQDLLRH